MGKPNTLSWMADHETSVDDNSNITLLTSKLFTVCMLEGLAFAGPELNILCDICKGIKSPAEELIAKAAAQLQKSSTRSLRSREWSDRDGLLYFHGHIYIPPDSNLHCHIVSLCHDTKVAGHAGRFKTLELVSHNYWWSNMSWCISQYVSTCDLCLWTKAQCCLPTEELQQLPVPEGHWETMSMDFIVELLESGGYDAIMVVVDPAGKQSHFIKTITTFRAAEAANLYLRNV
jgi:hypothetical protein